MGGIQRTAKGETAETIRQRTSENGGMTTARGQKKREKNTGDLEIICNEG